MTQGVEGEELAEAQAESRHPGDFGSKASFAGILCSEAVAAGP